MAKKREIRTVSFVHIGEELVNTDDLDDDQRRRLATWLKTSYLNALFQGKAEFFAPFCMTEKQLTAPGPKSIMCP